jgi:hypothetical protein
MCFQKLYSLEPDLHISDTQYLIALTVFFFPYSLFEVSYSLHTTQRENHNIMQPASNVVLRLLRPSIWLSTLMLGWGIVMTLHGVIHDYGGLLSSCYHSQAILPTLNDMVPTAVRFFLGLFEAGLYPGIVFYLSWSVSFAHKVIF